MTGGKNGGVHVTDVTNASRTLLMNIETLHWDPVLTRAFSINPEMLPEIRSSSEIIGLINDETVLSGIPISGVSITYDSLYNKKVVLSWYVEFIL